MEAIGDISDNMCAVKYCKTNSEKYSNYCELCKNPMMAKHVLSNINDSKIELNTQKIKYFKYIPTPQFVIDFMEYVCELDNHNLYFNKITFRKHNFFNTIPEIQQNIEFFFKDKYMKYVDNMDTFQGFVFIIKQLCMLYNIPITKVKKKILGVNETINYIDIKPVSELLRQI